MDHPAADRKGALCKYSSSSSSSSSTIVPGAKIRDFKPKAIFGATVICENYFNVVGGCVCRRFLKKDICLDFSSKFLTFLVDVFITLKQTQ